MNELVTQAIDNPDILLDKMITNPSEARVTLDLFTAQDLASLILRSHNDSKQKKRLLNTWIDMLSKHKNNPDVNSINTKITALLEENSAATPALLEKDWNDYKANKNLTFIEKTKELLGTDLSSLASLDKVFSHDTLAQIVKHLEPKTAVKEFNKPGADEKSTYWYSLLNEHLRNISFSPLESVIEGHPKRLIISFKDEAKGFAFSKLIYLGIDQFFRVNREDYDENLIRDYFLQQSKLEIEIKNGGRTSEINDKENYLIMPLKGRLRSNLAEKIIDPDHETRVMDWIPDTHLMIPNGWEEIYALWQPVVDQFSKDPVKRKLLIEKYPVLANRVLRYLIEYNPKIEIKADNLLNLVMESHERPPYQSALMYLDTLRISSNLSKNFYLEFEGDNGINRLVTLLANMRNKIDSEELITKISVRLSSMFDQMIEREKTEILKPSSTELLNIMFNDENYIILLFRFQKLDIAPWKMFETHKNVHPSIIIQMLNLYEKLPYVPQKIIDELKKSRDSECKKYPKLASGRHVFNFVSPNGGTSIFSEIGGLMKSNINEKFIELMNIDSIGFTKKVSKDNSQVEYRCYNEHLFSISKGETVYDPATSIRFAKKINSLSTWLGTNQLCYVSLDGMNIVSFIHLIYEQNGIRNTLDTFIRKLISESNPEQIKAVFEQNAFMITQIAPLLIADERFELLRMISDVLDDQKPLREAVFNRLDFFNSKMSFPSVYLLFINIMKDLCKDGNLGILEELLVKLDISLLRFMAQNNPDEFKTLFSVAGNALNRQFPELVREYVNLLNGIELPKEQPKASAPIKLPSIEEFRGEMKKYGTSYKTTQFLIDHPSESKELIQTTEDRELFIRNLDDPSMNFTSFIANSHKSSFDIFSEVARALIDELKLTGRKSNDNLESIIKLFKLLLGNMKDDQLLNTGASSDVIYIRLILALVEVKNNELANQLLTKLPHMLIMRYADALITDFYRVNKQDNKTHRSPLFMENLLGSIEYALKKPDKNIELSGISTKDDGLLIVLIKNLPVTKEPLRLLLQKLNDTMYSEHIEKFDTGHVLEELSNLASQIYTNGNLSMAQDFVALLPVRTRTVLSKELDAWAESDAKRALKTSSLHLFMSTLNKNNHLPPNESVEITAPLDEMPPQYDFQSITDTEILENSRQKNPLETMTLDLARLRMNTDTLKEELEKIKDQVQKIQNDPTLVTEDDFDSAIKQELEEQEAIRKQIAELTLQLTKSKPHPK